MLTRDKLGQPTSRPHGNPAQSFPVTRDGRPGWVGTVYPNGKAVSEFWLDGENLGDIPVGEAIETHAARHPEALEP